MTTPTAPAAATPATARQREVLAAIAAYWRTHGRPPGLRDICVACGISSPNGVIYTLTALAAKGLIDWSRDRRSRGVFLPGLKQRIAAAVDELAAAG